MTGGGWECYLVSFFLSTVSLFCFFLSILKRSQHTMWPLLLLCKSRLKIAGAASVEGLHAWIHPLHNITAEGFSGGGGLSGSKCKQRICGLYSRRSFKMSLQKRIKVVDINCTFSRNHCQAFTRHNNDEKWYCSLVYLSLLSARLRFVAMVCFLFSTSCFVGVAYWKYCYAAVVSSTVVRFLLWKL